MSTSVFQIFWLCHHTRQMHEKDGDNKEKVDIQFGAHRSLLEKQSSGTCLFIAKGGKALQCKRV